MDNMEKLAVAQALYKETAKLVNGKDPGSLRSAVNSEYMELYEKTGAKSFDVKIGGEKVGTYSLKESKPTEQEETEVFSVRNYVELAQWFDQYASLRELKEFASHKLADYAQWVFETTGEIADGCEIVTEITPAEPSRVTGSVLKIDPEKVAKAAQLPPSIAGLLGAGYE